MACTAFAQAPGADQHAVEKTQGQPEGAGRIATGNAGPAGLPERGLRFLDLEDSRPRFEPGVVRPRQKFGVCVGIDGYLPGSGYGRLEYAGSDAIAVADALLSQCGFDRVLLMTDAKIPPETIGRHGGARLQVVTDLRRDTILNAVAKHFMQATGVDDIIVFYFAGHGDVRPTACLIPTDYHRQTAPANTIRLSEIFELLLIEPVYARNKLVVLDACRSSPSDASGRIMAPAFREALIQPGQRMAVVTSCDARESSREDQALQHGRFTLALIQALAGEAYPPGEENLLVTHIYEHVCKVFETRGWGGPAPGRQNPQMFSMGALFALTHREVPKPQPLDRFEWDDLNRDQREARKLYLSGQLEQASSKYRYCLRVMETPPQDDGTVRRVRGRLLAERARALYRLGRAAEADAGLKLAESLARGDPASLEIRGYLEYDGGRYHQAAEQLERAVAGQAAEGNVSAYLFFRLGMTLYRLERYEPAAAYFLKATETSERFALKRDAAQYRRWAAQSFAAVSRLDLAEKLLRDVLDRLDALPEADSRSELAATRLALAEVLRDQGQYPAAIAAVRAAMAIQRKANPAKPENPSRSLQLLAEIYFRIGDYQEAEERYKEVLKWYEANADRRSSDHARLLNDLAELYLQTGSYAHAVRILSTSLQITAETRGQNSSQYALILNNLGLAYYFQGDYPQAESLLRKALAIQLNVLGDQNPQTASNLHNLALLREAQGDFAEARELLDRSYEIRQHALGWSNPETAASLVELGDLLRVQKKETEAENVLRRALDIHQTNLDLATGLSERQQLAMAQKFRRSLDAYLSVVPNPDSSNGADYAFVLRWKGTVFARQRRQRTERILLREARDPEAARLCREVQELTRLLAALSLSDPGPGEAVRRINQIAELSKRKQILEYDLALRSATYRTARHDPTPEEIKKSLPHDVALVDLLEYTRYRQVATATGKLGNERRLVAFVVRPDRPIARVELGVAEPINSAVDRWRDSSARLRPPDRATEPGAELRKRLWEPLVERLVGAKVVLVSPDGAVNGLPWAALPGSKPGTFLVHDFVFAVVPVPALLPELLQSPPPQDKQPPSLLLAGGIDFGKPMSGDSTKLRPRRAFPPLPGTEAEVNDLRAQFEDTFPEAPPPKRLTKDKATKAAVVVAVPAHRFVHLATHSFSGHGLDNSADVAVRGHPGLLAGLVFAGFNRPDRRPEEAILTALEVAEMELDKVELVVLSASETGLGRIAAGEGVLGLQRAFQLVGARSVVASLWNVPDEETHQLMREFYRRVWSKDRVSKAEALRQAQLWMIQHGVRGRGLERRQPPPAPPFYWAAFVVSGDWR
jgi:CHAT domain-containing protein/Flp pilus assembly protein TadD